MPPRRTVAFTAALGLLAVGIFSAAEAHAQGVNTVGKVEAKADGEKTVIVVHGSAMPSFTAYRLERPSRLVVDLANGRLAHDASHDGPMDVDSWAVGQIATAQYATDTVKTARIMINLKRTCTYDAKPVGNDLYITITASDAMPANGAAAMTADATRKAHEAERATAAAESRRQQVLAQLADEEKRLSVLKDARAEEERRAKRQTDAQKAEAEANRRAEAARMDADTAKARALAARAELERIQITRVAEEAKVAELQRRAAAGGERESRELARLREQANQEQARLQGLKAEADRQAQRRAAEVQKIDEAQAEARRADEKKSIALEQARVLADKRANDAASLRMTEERRAQAQADEANRLAQAVEAQRKLARTEAQRQAAEAAATKAAEQAHVDEERVAKLRLEGDRIARAAEQARLSVENARKETLALAEKQAQERAKLESARTEARRLADQRQLEIERAGHATALLSGEKTKIEAAEKEAKRLAELRQKESVRLEQVRMQADLAVTARTEELRKLDEARASQKATVAAHERELQALSARKERELRALAEARAGEEAKIAVARNEVQRTRSELVALEQQRAAQKDEAQKTRRELLALDSQRVQQAQLVQRAKSEAQSELDALEAQKLANKTEAQRAKSELATLEAQRALQKDAALKSRSEIEQLEAQKLAQKVEAKKTRGELASLEAQRQQLEAQRISTSSEAQRARAEIDSKRAEREALERKIGEAKAELEKAELQAKMVAQKAEEAQRRAVAQAAVKTAPVPVPVIDPPLSPKAKELARAGRMASALVRDIRFADDAESDRVVIEMQGEPDWRTTPSHNGELTLRLSGVELPRRLERTLDTAAYKGPVRSVSTYPDPNEAGVVRVVVALNRDVKGGEPKVTKEGGRLVWEFPREAHSQSIAPTRVGGYGASIPLQVSAGSTNLPQAQQGRRRPSFSGRRIDLDFKDFDIHNILRMLSDVGQVNIITSDDVKGTITIRMRDVPWDQALEVILRSKSLGMQREGNLIRVAPLKVLEQEMEAEIARAKAAIELKPLDTRLIPLSYASGDKMLPRVQELLSSRGKVSVDERTNMLIVSDVASNISLAEDLIRNLDTQTPQVLIEARVVEARQTFTRTIGIQWGGSALNSASTGNPTGLVFPSTVGVAGAGTDTTAPTAGLLNGQATNPNYVVNLPAAIGTGSGGGLGVTLGSLTGAYNINLRLSALEASGEVRIVSAPKITTLDNVEASIEQGVAIPISVVSAAGTNTIFVDAKLNLTVKPHVTNEGSVAMLVNITRNEPDFVNVGARGDPTILKKQARTEMLVRDGDTAVIGGIYTRNSGMAYQKLPWIADVPILGWLFKNKRENDDRTELLIFITPRIVNRQMVAR